MSKARRIFHHKALIQGRLLLELNIFSVPESHNFPESIKYRLFCTELRGVRKILFDNHAPKGHHFHVDNEEFDYTFIDSDHLIEDFREMIFVHFGVRL